jgi:hypothetical protein
MNDYLSNQVIVFLKTFLVLHLLFNSTLFLFTTHAMHGIVCIVSSGHCIEQANCPRTFLQDPAPPGGHFQNFLRSGRIAAPKFLFDAAEARHRFSPKNIVMNTTRF